MNNKEHKSGIYETRAIAFIDILGMREMITSNKNSVGEKITPLDLEQVFDKISKFKAVDLQNLCQGLPIKINSILPQSRQVTTFSDSIVISFPVKSFIDAYLFILDVANVQNSLLELGVLTRGGISFGKLYHKEDRIFGPALIKAYDLEYGISIFPRVIVDQVFLRQIQNFITTFVDNDMKGLEEKLSEKTGVGMKYGRGGVKKQISKQLNNDVFNLLSKDLDGLVFVDYLYISNVQRQDILLRQIAADSCNKVIKKQRKKRSLDQKIIQKWSWVGNYAVRKKALAVAKLPFSKNKKAQPLSIRFEVKNDYPAI